MLKEILFWKDWNPLFKSIYFFLLFLFFASIAFFVFGYQHTHESIIPWQTINYIESKAYPILDISKGIFSIPIEHYTYYVTQNYKASTLQVNFDAVNFFCIIMALMYVFLFSVITYFKGWWYYLANTLVIVTIAGLRFDLFMVFGDIRNIFILFIITSSVGLSIFYHFKRPYTTFMIRLLSYFMLFTIYALIILYGSNIQNPQLYLTSYGLFAPLFISLIFIIIVSFDVEYVFLYFSTSSKSLNPKSNTLNFMFIGLLYVINILMTVLYRRNFIDWDLYYFDEYLMLAFSTLAGFWVYRRRLEASGAVIPFIPFGAFFYLIMASITWLTIGYAHATGNTSIIRSIRELILYSHFGIGLMFMIYVLYSYTIDINRNLPVYEIVLKPSKPPIHYIRIGGFIILFGLSSTNNYLVMDYFISGYYSNVADVYMHEKNYPLASQYYNKVAEHKEFDFKRSLGMAAISEAYEDDDDAIAYYNQMHESFDCEQSYINEAFLYDKKGNSLKALNVLKDGLRKYPKSSNIYINIGNIYSKIKFTDSAYYYYELAEKDERSAMLAKTNKLSLAINQSIDLPNSQLDSSITHMPFLINLLSYKNIKDQELQINYIDNPEKEEYWMYHVNFLGNHILYKDSAAVNHNTRLLLKRDSTDVYSEKIRYIDALYAYAKQDVNKAMEHIYNLKNHYLDNSSLYANTLGIMAITQKQPEKAFEYFNESYNHRNAVGGMNGLIALTDLKSKEKIVEYSERLINSTESTVRGFTKELLNYSTATSSASSEDRIKHLNINKKYYSSSELVNMANAVIDDNLQAEALLIVQSELIERKEFELAKAVYIQGLSDPQKVNILNLNQLFIKLHDKQYKEIIAQIDQVKLNIEDEPFKDYIRVMAYYNLGDTVHIKPSIEKMLQSLPLYTESLLFAIDYYEQKGNIDKAYQISADAVTINNYNTKVKMKLCMLSIPKGLGTFVDKQIEELRHELSPTEYMKFKAEFDRALEKQNSNFNW